MEVDDRPHQHVNEDDDGKEDPSAAGVYAEKQDEVAKEAQDNHPHHVQAVHASDLWYFHNN